MLPPSYDKDEAGNRLANVISNAEADLERNALIPQFSSVDLNEFQVQEYMEPRCWKVSMVNDHTGEASPVRMRLQGIISDLDLPPIRKPANKASMERMRPFIRQSLKLTGVSRDEFHRFIENLEFVQVMFNGALPPNTLRDYQPTYEGHNIVIEMHNRYFIKKDLAPNRHQIMIHGSIDPEGVLDQMQRDGQYIHTLDNNVNYYQAGTDANGEPPFTVPTLFRVGDLVETIVEFIAFPTGRDSAIAVVVLKAVQMISPDLRNKASILEMRARYKPPSFNVKRRLPKDSREDVDAVKRSNHKKARSTDFVEGSSKATPASYNAPIQEEEEVAIPGAYQEEGKDTKGTLWDMVEEAQVSMMKMQVSDPQVDP